MNREDAWRRLPEYVEGSLSAEERRDFERLLSEDPELGEAVTISKRIEVSLRSQPWIEPSPDFTRTVLAHAGISIVRPEPIWVVQWERIKVALSAAALLLILALYGRTLISWSGEMLSSAGNWLEMLTGYSLFAIHPIIVLGLIAPLLAGGYATCVLTGRCRLNS